MAFLYYNAHPKRLNVADCTKRSISLTTGMPYNDVQKGLNAHKKVTGAKLFYSNQNPGSYMENVLGFPKTTVPKKSGGAPITVEAFAKANPRGRYVVSVLGHWTACIDGVIYDTWDCTKEVVLSYYKITRFQKTKIEKKYCFAAKRRFWGGVSVTVYDGNGMASVKKVSKRAAHEYMESLCERGFFNYDEIGDYI